MTAPNASNMWLKRRRQQVHTGRSPERDQLDMLLDLGVSTALDLLTQHKEFYPFGVAMYPNGQIGLVSTEMPTDKPLSDDVIEQLYKNFRGMKKRYKAIGVVSDVRVTVPSTGKVTDAVRVALEHREAEPVTCLVPYHWSGNDLVQEEVSAESGKDLVFE